MSTQPVEEGDGFVVVTPTGALRYRFDRDEGEPLPAPHLLAYEQVSDVVLHEGRMFVATNRARLLVLDPVSGEQVREASLGVVGRIELAPAPGDVVALTQDGVLHRLDGALAAKGSLWLGMGAQHTSERFLNYAPNSSVYPVRTATRGILVAVASTTITPTATAGV